MEDFRARRKRKAEEMNEQPVLAWHHRVDGRLTKGVAVKRRRLADKGIARETKRITLGDIGFADDTALVGKEDEARRAGEILIQTLADWEERVNESKTERLRISGVGRALFDVRGVGEKAEVRHIGGWLSEDSKQKVDTQKKCNSAKASVRLIAKAWSVGTSHGRGETSGVKRSARLKVMKNAIIPSLLSFCRSRPWTEQTIEMAQKVANYAVRRAMGMDILIMRELHVSDDQMYKAAGWESIQSIVNRASMFWLGHVARMSIQKRPKQMLFGWWEHNAPSLHGKGVSRVTQPMYMSKVLRAGEISEMDWFRLAQDRKGWRRMITRKWPNKKIDAVRERQLNEWRPGETLPGQTGEDPAEGEAGGVRYALARLRREEPQTEPEEEEETEEEEDEPGDRQFECPVCSESFTTGNRLRFHYDEAHSVRDPNLVTSVSYKCDRCKTFFPKFEMCRDHMCPLVVRERSRTEVSIGGWLPVRHGPDLPPPRAWWAATDGSGQAGRAGWGVAIFRWPLASMVPEFVLHGPVVTKEWDHLWMGARELTNNTAELTAIGELMIWLDTEAPDDRTTPTVIRFDSFYAANMAQGFWEPKANEELAHRVRELVKKVGQRRTLTWEYVYGHTGEHDNEIADRAADAGAKNKVSEQSQRWAAPPPPLPEAPRVKMDRCKKCGAEFPEGFVRGSIRWHVERCEVPEDQWVVPRRQIKCRKCGCLMAYGYRPRHEAKCRGSVEANTTCSKCGKTGFPLRPTGLSRALGNHEVRCDGQIRADRRRAGAKAKAKAAPKSKSRAKSKAKARAMRTPTPKPKAKPTAKRWARSRAPVSRARSSSG